MKKRKKSVSLNQLSTLQPLVSHQIQGVKSWHALGPTLQEEKTKSTDNRLGDKIPIASAIWEPAQTVTLSGFYSWNDAKIGRRIEERTVEFFVIHVA